MYKTIDWILKNINKNEGVVISNNNRMSYPEVSGYLIPTLINLGYKKEALDIGVWLSKIQNEDGSIPLGPNKFTFDTAMVLSGWQALGGFKKNKEKACKFLLSQIKDNGQFSTEFHDQFVPEKILVWCANLLEKEKHDMSEVWAYYNQDNTFKFDCLSHFHCYVLDATLDTPLHARAVEAIKKLAVMQKKDGSISAHIDVDWTCYTGVAQAALLFYKIGLKENGDKAMQYLEKIVNEQGGILGSNGDYFNNDELSWAAKFYIDAYQIMIEKEMDKQCEIFSEDIPFDDPRVLCLKNEFNEKKHKNILDIGCGKGRYLKHNINIIKSYGVDISQVLINYCKDNYLVKKGLATNLPFINNTFDGAYSVEVFEHFAPLIENGLKEAFRILKPGGKFVLIDKHDGIVGDKEKWEGWFNINEVTELMQKYFVNVKVEKLSDIFVAWVGEKTSKFEMNHFDAVPILDDIINKLNICEIGLLQGTTLGAYREESHFISGDHDIDLFLFEPIDIVNLASKFSLDYKVEYNSKFLSLRKNNIIVDIHVGSFEDDLFVIESPVTIDKYPKHLFENMGYIYLYNHKFLVPNDIVEYLHLCYNNWQEPKLNTDRDNLMVRIWKNPPTATLIY